MAVTTYREFVDSLEAIEVTGVVRRFTHGPPVGSPGTADIPAQYVRYPGSDEIPIVFGEGGGWPTLRCEFVILVEAVGQSTQERNFDKTVDMMDNLAAAFRAAPCITKSKLTWGLRQTIDTVAGQDYWAIVAPIEGRG